MINLGSDPSSVIPMDTIKAALPIGIGLASAAYLAVKVASNSGFDKGKSVPMVSIRPGDSTHDNEYNDNQDAFLQRCEEEHGPIFNILLLNKALTVVSGPLIREVFMNDDMSSSDAIEEFTNMNALFSSIRKSNHDIDHKTIHALVREYITPNLSLFTPGIAEQLKSPLEQELSNVSAGNDGQLVEQPMVVLQEMVASAMASVFMGLEAAQSRQIIDIFTNASADFGMMLGSGQKYRASIWRSLVNRTNYKVLNPLQIHVRNLVEAATPMILQRRRLEAEAVEKGIEYKRPNDILQLLLDNFDKYDFVDIEDFIETLYEEQRDVLDTIQQEREQKRQELVKKGEPISEDLDPSHDYGLSAAAIKKMVHMDSFIREMFRYRTERLTLVHRARKNVTLSTGVVITKGNSVIINMKSAHQGPEQGEDVTEFIPLRFVGKSKAATKAGADFLPFGMGRHACPGRFLAIHQVKIIGVLMVSKYSMIEIQDPSKTMRILHSRIGEPACTGLIFKSRSSTTS
ncbi:hypothetical protein BGZ65_005513 [Modicella reniformis]|uniref:Cytochrome P450 n=1 Tax=Modicella reniformis TaxID=1440133 RepID=A0A9P6M2K3_9FUNG|nr:hypothetical protein BGZ65_005513 [Modicella reniformis]